MPPSPALLLSSLWWTETFAAWKAQFEAETALSQTRLEAEAALKASGPTGKQWFLQQEAAGTADQEPAEVRTVPQPGDRLF